MQRKIALVYYHCAASLSHRTDTKGAFAHDEALLDYAHALQASFPPSPDPEAMSQLSGVVSGLSKSTKFREIEKATIAWSQQLPTPEPTLPPPNPESCGAVGFDGILSDWEAQYGKYATDVAQTNRAGAQRATLLNELIYGASHGVESSDVAKMEADEERLNAALDGIRASGMARTADAAAAVLTRVHDTDTDASLFTQELHSGIAGAQDRDHVAQSRLAVDDAASRLSEVYCKA